jgi:uncharacterized RDD family membrane protein YckC
MDSSLPMQTPEGIEFVLHPAGFPIRACAWAIDGFIKGIFVFAFIIAMGILGSAIGTWFFLIIIFVLDWFYHTFFEVFFRGQSPGKRFMGIRVVNGDGSPVSAGASFLRNLLRFADTFLFLYLIALICMLSSPAFKRLGDWGADTLVVYTDYARSTSRFASPALRKAGMPWLADFPIIYPVQKLEYDEKQAILMFARRYPLLGKARSDEIAAIWADEIPNASAYLLGIAHSLTGD